MRRLVIELTANAPASFSARAATEGMHQSLDVPTGAALMGWAASQCYDNLGGAGAVTVFHSGKVRFSDCVRIWNEKSLFRNPSTLLKSKHGGENYYLGRANFKADAANKEKQAEAAKNLWLSLDGDRGPEPRNRLRLRNSQNRNRRIAEQLFGTDALAARRTVYRAVIECDDHVLDEKSWDILCNTFEGTIRLGKSRRSGYGGEYQCRVLKDHLNPWPQPELPDGELVRFWLLSDAQLQDEWGQPRLMPIAKDFGLVENEWKYHAAESSISTRRVWPWNRQYNSRDVELALVEAGSVVAFCRIAGTSGGLSPLIGTGHERGYGRYVGLQKDFTVKPCCNPDPSASKAGTSENGANGQSYDALIQWASGRANMRVYSENPEWTQNMIAEGRRFIDRMEGGHPAPSQWSELAQLLNAWVSRDQDFGRNLADRLSNPSWDSNYAGLGNWVRNRLFNDPIDGTLPAQRVQSIENVIKALRAYRPEVV